MAIDISSIVRKHLSNSNADVEGAVTTDDTIVEDVVKEAVTTDDTIVEDVVEEGTLKVDFSSIVEGVSKDPTDTISVADDHVWFMTEDERSTVQGALLAAVVTNAVEL